MKPRNPLPATILAVMLILPAAAAGDPPQWGGHLRGRAEVLWPDSSNGIVDGIGEARLKSQANLSSWGRLDLHYEGVWAVGDTAGDSLSAVGIDPGGGTGGPPGAPRRLMDLSRTVTERGDAVAYHRIDRLSLTLFPQWGTVTLGRQALTWGNGLLFNPMDLFNPFSPTDFDRDYKVGDDMVSVSLAGKGMTGLQGLYVPRRSEDGDLDWTASSAATKLHTAVGTTELDLTLAVHYGDPVVGVGAMGYLGGAAWRSDLVVTSMDDAPGSEAAIQWVVNLDYAWTLGGKNCYGGLEYYHNSLGADDPADAAFDPVLMERLVRGEIHTLGRDYLAGQVRIELHPLVNAFFTGVVNLGDPSAVFQPRAVYDFRQNLQWLLGGTVYAGGPGTEYGGFDLAAGRVDPAPALYTWITWFF